MGLNLDCGEPAPPPVVVRPPRPRPKPPATAARPANTPNEQSLALAYLTMGRPKKGRCGPYRLATYSSDPRLLAACEKIGATLDDVYAGRFGVTPIETPAEEIILFGDLADYRHYVEEDGRLAAGYAGFASDIDGLVVLHAGSGRKSAITTLAHELTHLVHRRALGTNLPPWLSEGLADAIGYGTTEEGIGPLRGIVGVEALAERLRGALDRGWARPLPELTGLPRSDFDHGLRSFDYEQSALLVRYLLLDRELAPRFKGYLASLARGERYDPERLRAALGVSWEEMETGFGRWLRSER
ncbi:MAG: hypothetical protein ABJC13_22495 [Acidobacteriota bacterium]